MKQKYIHTESAHNLEAPGEIVPVLVEIFQPESVVDVGCGLGNFLKCFIDYGVKEVLGLDGKWTNRELLFKNINSDQFMEVDLEQPLSINKKFDLLLSLEVAEHLSEKSADTFVNNLVSLSDVIIFSAAIPFQGGQNHINEQWCVYWEEKFLEKGYVLYDVFKPFFWENKKIFWWYKQNMYLVVKKNIDINHLKLRSINAEKNIQAIHPELYLLKVNWLNDILKGNFPLRLYINLFVKAVLQKFKR